MVPEAGARSGPTFVELEFDTSARAGAPLGDIASSLVSVDELLRDLASIAAYPSSVEFRNIEVVAIEMRSPLRIKLSLFAIPAEAVKAFQEICCDIIVYRERRGRHAALTASAWEDVSAERLPNIKTALDMCSSRGGEPARITEQEAQRLYRHIASLQNAELALKRIEVKEE